MLRIILVALSVIALINGDELGIFDDQSNAAVADDTPKSCDQGRGECVPYYLCKDGKINTDGSDLLDIRFDEGSECVDYFEQCCSTGDVLPEKIIPPINPPPGPGPPGTLNPIPIPGGEPVKVGCGFRNTEGVGFRITGATDNEAEYGEFPWMLAILKEEVAAEQILNVYQCGGSLITPNVAVTAAHCVEGKSPSILKVRAGEWDTQTKNELFHHTDHSVTNVVVHEKFYKGGLHNDIALLFLKESVRLGDHINTICLPPQDQNFDNKKCFSTGWGKNVFGKEGVYQTILKKIELPTVPAAKCQENLRKTRLGRRFNLHESFMCAGGDKGKDACKGDGGSPLICPVDGKPGHYYQAGIVAWGIGCGEENVPGVYVNVAKFRSWIDQKIAEKSLPTNSYII